MGNTHAHSGGNAFLVGDRTGKKEEYMKIVMVLYPGNDHKVEFGELEGQPIPGSADGEIGLREYLEG